MSQFRMNLVLFVGVCVSLSSGCSPSLKPAKFHAAITQEVAEAKTIQTPPNFEITTESISGMDITTPKPLTCESCYTNFTKTCIPRVCEKVSSVARTADDLARSFDSELQHQLRKLSAGTEATSARCSIEKPAWEKLSTALLENLKGSEGPSCHLKLPNDGATCAAVSKLMECAFAHMHIAYATTRYCLSDLNHLGWHTIHEQLKDMARINYLKDAISIESRIRILRRDLDTIIRELSESTYVSCEPFQCVFAPIVGSVHIDYLTQEDDFDDTWYTMTAEDE